MYQQIPDISGHARIDMIQRASDGAFIPFDSSNKDYQAYQEWREKGNSPLPLNP